MIALLAEQAAAAAESTAVPAWVAVVVGLLSVLGGASWQKIQGGARAARRIAATVESILDLVDGEDPPEERRATFSAFLAAHGRDPEFLAALAAYRDSKPSTGVVVSCASSAKWVGPSPESPPRVVDATKPPEVKS